MHGLRTEVGCKMHFIADGSVHLASRHARPVGDRPCPSFPAGREAEHAQTLRPDLVQLLAGVRSPRGTQGDRPTIKSPIDVQDVASHGFCQVTRGGDVEYTDSTAQGFRPHDQSQTQGCKPDGACVSCFAWTSSWYVCSNKHE
jgi:hypothetical protein